MTKKIIIDWVRHGESCSNLISGYIKDKPEDTKSNKTDTLMQYNFIDMIKSTLVEPPLTHIGTQHAINIGKNYIANNTYDFYITSGLSRTIMTGLFALSQYKDNIKRTLYVVPFINEYEYIKLFSLDKQNRAVELHILIRRIKLITQYIKSLSIDISNITIDFSLYDEDKELQPLISNYNSFVKYIVPKLLKKKNINSDKINIVAFSHGLFMKGLFKEQKQLLKETISPSEKVILKNFMNTQVITQTLVDSNTTEIKINDYIPLKVRKIDTNDMLENEGICFDSSLLTKINQILNNKYLKYKNKYVRAKLGHI